MQDFFAAIEEEQTTMFNPQTGSPSIVFPQQQPTFNPFSQGNAFGTTPFHQPPGVQPQQTGFFIPQQTGYPTHSVHNPFGQHLQPQPTATPLMPQMTAINPFRHNTLNGMNDVQMQATGFSPLPFVPPQTNPSPFGPSSISQGVNQFPVFGQIPEQQQQISFSPFGITQQPTTNSPFTLPQQLQQQQSQPPPQPQSQMNAPVPPRPASVPLKTNSPEPIKPLAPQQTGSRNPFGIPTSPAPPVPKVPTLMELAMNKQKELRQMQQQQQNGQVGQTSSVESNPNAGSLMSSVASDFAGLNVGYNQPTTNSLSPQMTSTTNSSFSMDTLFTSVSTQQTGATTSTVPSISAQPASGPTSHTTGLGTFTGLKTFKPSSSFGASLLESLPPIPGSTIPAVTGGDGGQLGPVPSSTVSSPGPTTTTQNGLGSTLGISGLNTQATALNSQQPLMTGLGTGLSTGGLGTGLRSNLGTMPGMDTTGTGVGLGPQRVDAQGAGNPFKATMFSGGVSTTGFGGVGSGVGMNPGLAFGGGFGSLSGVQFGQNQNAQPQQRQQGSLI